MKMKFTKSMIKTGRVVDVNFEYLGVIRYFVLNDRLIGENGFVNKSDINNDGTLAITGGADILRVYEIVGSLNKLNDVLNDDNLEIIYELTI